MLCAFCHGETHFRRVTKQHWLRRRLYVVEKVPAEVCAECGERYFHAKTLDALDALLTGAHRVKKRLDVEVVRMI